MQIKKRESKKNFEKLNVMPRTEIQENAFRFFSELNPVTLKLFDVLLSYSNTCRKIWISQTTLAVKVGISRQYCNKLLGYLEEEGLIISNYRHMRTSLYKISSFFRSLKVRRILYSLFNAFKAVSLALLTQLNIHGYMNKEYIIKNTVPHTIQRGTWRMEDLLRKNLLLDAIKNRENYENLISESIRTINGLPLTKWGQIKLSAFSDEVIEAVKDQFYYTFGIRKPFDWFFYACLRYCKQHDLSPHWGWSKKLELACKMPENAPMLRTSKKNRKRIPFIRKRHSVSYVIPSFKQNKSYDPTVEKEKIVKASQNKHYAKLAAIVGTKTLDGFRDRVINNITKTTVDLSR